MAGKNGENRRMSPLQCLHEEMSVWAEYTGIIGKEL